jgi:hypothetical protein
MLDDSLPTATSKQQNALEKKLLGLYQVCMPSLAEWTTSDK